MNEDEREPNPDKRGSWVSAAIALLGFWLVASPFLFGAEPGVVTAAGEVVVGLLALGLGTYSAVAIWNRRKAADARATATDDRTGQ